MTPLGQRATILKVAEWLDDRTAALLSVAKRQWERTFDAISEPLMIVDGECKIMRANLALAEGLELPIRQVVGRRCFEVRAGSAQVFPRTGDGPCDGCAVPGAQRTGAPAEADMRSLAGRTFRLRAYPLLDEGAALTVCSYHDQTDEREMTRQLSNAEKLAAIGRLAGGVAHEINNPLGGILAFTQILQRDEVSVEDRREYLGEIEKSALRCKAIVDSLLRFARQSPHLDRRALSLNDLVKETVPLVHYKYSVRDVRVECTLAEGLPPVLANANQIQQVLVNLLGNAFDSIARAGRIEVTTALRDGQVVLAVSDTGSGIKEEHMPRLFDPFFTTKEEGKGTGLGLAVTYAILQEHGGRITVANRPGSGAEFTVFLPPLPPPPAEPT